MTFWYPDISNVGNNGLILEPNTVAVIAKGSEGTTFKDPSYTGFKAQAHWQGSIFGCYHWLWPAGSSNIQKQAQNALAVAGDVGLMMDVENMQGWNSVSDIVQFTNAYRALGGVVNLLYLPHWYWQGHMGSASLQPCVDLGLKLISSNYTTYSDSGPGWEPYGGMTPDIWQYTSSMHYGNNTKVDFNACKASLVDFAALLNHRSDVPAPKPPAQPPQSSRLSEDGELGPLTIKAWQRRMGTTIDGVITGPWSRPPGKSSLVMAVQRYLNQKINARLVVDGVGIRQDSKTIYATTKALQHYLGTTDDGKLSLPSLAVKTLQHRLNTGTF